MANVALTCNRNGFTNEEAKRVPKRGVSIFVMEEQKKARYILLLPTPLGSYSAKATPISVSVAGRAPRKRLSFFGALRYLFRRL